MTIRSQDIFGASPKTVLNKPFMQVAYEGVQAILGADGIIPYPLNTVDTNEIAGASLLNNEIQLPAGKYYIEVAVSIEQNSDTGTRDWLIVLKDSNNNSLVKGEALGTYRKYVTQRTNFSKQITFSQPTSIKVVLESTYSANTGDVNGRGAEVNIWKLDDSVETIVVDPAKVALVKPKIIVRDVRSSGTTSQSVPSQTVTTKEFNSITVNDISGASLTNNQVSLPAGKYEFIANVPVPASSTGRASQWALYVDDVRTVSGHNQNSIYYQGSSHFTSTFVGEFTLTETSLVDLRVWCSSTGKLGTTVSDGEEEVYGELSISKLDSLIQTPVLSDPTMVAARPLFHVRDEKPNGTAGGASVVGYQTRDINTVRTNEISGASLSNNEITLPAGEYYIEANVSMGYIGRGRLSLRNITGGSTLVLIGLSGGNTTNNTNANQLMSGKFTLTETSALDIRQYAQSAYSSGLGVALSASVRPEVYADIKIWQLDALRQTPVIINDKLYPLPGNTMVTGNMHGLDYSKTGDNQVTVEAGICMDSTNNVTLDLATPTILSIPTDANTVYNLFLCKETSGGAMVLRQDTDVNGTNLTGIDALRWIGFVLNNSSGDLRSFRTDGDMFSFEESVTISSGNGGGTFSLTNFRPSSRTVVSYCSGKNHDQVYFKIYSSGDPGDGVGGSTYKDHHRGTVVVAGDSVSVNDGYIYLTKVLMKR